MIQETALVSSIAVEINSEHCKATIAANSAINHALRIGELLTQAKATIKHGEWLSWVTENLSFGDRQARKYMQVFLCKDAIESNRNCGADIGINAALQLIASPVETPATDDEFLLSLEMLGMERFLFGSWASVKGETLMAAITPIFVEGWDGSKGIWYNLETYEFFGDDYDLNAGGITTFTKKGLDARGVRHSLNSISGMDDWPSAEWQTLPHHGKKYWMYQPTRMERLGY